MTSHTRKIKHLDWNLDLLKKEPNEEEKSVCGKFCVCLSSLSSRSNSNEERINRRCFNPGPDVFIPIFCCYLLPIVKLPRQYKFCCSAFVLISVPQPSLREISIKFLAISLSLPLNGRCVSIFKYTGKFSQAFASHRPSQNHGTVSSCTDHWINTQFGLCWPKLRKIPNYQLPVIVVFSHL